MSLNSQSNVVIYSQNNCAACETAKNIMHKHGIFYTLYNISNNPEAKNMLQNQVPGVRSVPQIFINGNHIGGVTELLTYIDAKI